METLDSLILLSRNFKKTVAAFVAPFSVAYFPIRALSSGVSRLVFYLPRGDCVTGFEFPDRECLKLCLRVRYPSQTERKHVRGVGTTTSFL